MRRSTAFFSAIALFVWLLPLGAFIRPTQEKAACGGKRAFHMCHMQAKVHHDTDSRAPVVADASGSGVEARSAGAGSEFTSGHEQIVSLGHSAPFFLNRTSFTSFILESSIDHPPSLRSIL